MQQVYNCPNCQAPVAYGEPFCRNCGTPFTWEAPQEPPPPQSYDQQQYDQQQQWGQQQDWGQQQQPPGQAGWNQQPGWNQPPPSNQQAGWGYPNQYQQQYGDTRPGARAKKKKPLNRTNLIFAIIAIIVVLGGVIYGAISMLPPGTTAVPPEEETPGTTTTAQAKPIAISFSVSPTTVRKGQSTTLTWNVTGATEISIDQGIGKVPANGTKSVIPTGDTTTYVLTTQNDTSYKSERVTVSISEPVVPVINNFTANPGMINSGQTSSLQWNVTGALSIIIDQDIGPVSASGSRDMNPTQTTTYTLTATNTEGTVTKSVTVTVGTSGVPVIVSFTATPSNVDPGGTSTLEWNVIGATSVSLGGNTVLSSGTKVVNPTYSTTYNLTARNNIGTVTAKAVVTVGGATALTIDKFIADPQPTYDTDGKSTLKWVVFGAASVSITEIGTVSASGTQIVYLGTLTSKTYTLTATNSSGQTISEDVTITKGIVTLPQIIYFTADSYTITSGQSTYLRWNISGAETISITNIGTIPPSQYIQISPTTTTPYTLTATNSAGSVNSSTITIEVN